MRAPLHIAPRHAHLPLALLLLLAVVGCASQDLEPDGGDPQPTQDSGASPLDGSAPDTPDEGAPRPDASIPPRVDAAQPRPDAAQPRLDAEALEDAARLDAAQIDDAEVDPDGGEDSDGGVSGDQACVEVFDCVMDCVPNDIPCEQGCYEAGTPRAQEVFVYLVNCLGRTGCGATNDCPIQCSEEASMCFEGRLSCAEIYGCFEGCAEGDQICTNGCYDNGTNAAKQAYDLLNVCLDVTNCRESDICETVCAGELSVCFPE